MSLLHLLGPVRQLLISPRMVALVNTIYIPAIAATHSSVIFASYSRRGIHDSMVVKNFLLVELSAMVLMTEAGRIMMMQYNRMIPILLVGEISKLWIMPIAAR